LEAAAIYHIDRLRPSFCGLRPISVPDLVWEADFASESVAIRDLPGSAAAGQVGARTRRLQASAAL